MGAATAHLPVLRDAVVAELAVAETEGGGLLVDATVGAGGHAAALLGASGPQTRLLGIDRDADALALAQGVLEAQEPGGGGGRDAAQGRVVLVHASFDQLAEVVLEHRRPGEPVLGILFDLGVSSMQLDEGHRGFSLRREGPLDMRMDPTVGEPASALLDRLDEPSLARLLRAGGEDRHSRRIAAAIARARPLRTTRELAEVVSSALPARARGGPTHPATRTFQALRIAVNEELDRLARVLPQAFASLAQPVPGRRGGRLAVISYHSGEDRLVKRAMSEAARGCVCPPDLPVCGCGRDPALVVRSRGGITPDDAEVAHNPRARSARMRVAERTTAPLPEEVGLPPP